MEPGAGESEKRRADDAAGDEARNLLALVEELNGIEDTEILLDRLAEDAARIAGYGASLLSLALPEGAMVGTWNLPAEDRARFKRRALETNIDYRLEKRRKIRERAFPGTGICFIPADVDLPRSPVSPDYDGHERVPGTWDARDRLFLLVTGSRGREIGVFSLDFPLDGNRPTAGGLERLRVAERLLAIGGSLLQTRLLEQTLRREEEEMRAIVEQAPVGIYRRLADGRLLTANRRLAETFGYASPEDLLADRSAIRLLEPPGVAEAVDRLGEGEESAVREVGAARRDGRPLRVRHSARRLSSRGFVLGIVEDVTEASHLAEHLQRARRMEAVGTLASGIAHDFNNLLGGVLGYAALIREIPGLDPAVARSALSIEQAAERGADLTRRLLGLARDTPQDEIAVSVAPVLADCARIARETFDRRIEVAVEAEADLPAVRGRATDLHQAVINLCINARDSMPEGGRLRLRAARDREGPRAAGGRARAGEWVRIEVEDEGEGMDEATAARIFEPFFTTKARGKGTGLGLYMVYITVQAHGGMVDVESAPGRGTRFILHLPAAAPSTAAAEPLPAAAPPARARPARILLVEDEAMIRDLSEGVLRRAGHSVTTAADGDRALALAGPADVPFDLVVLDLVLPGRSGSEVYRFLRERQPALPVLLCSGNPEDDMVDPSMRAGVAGILRKPYRPAELERAVARALAPRT